MQISNPDRMSSQQDIVQYCYNTEHNHNNSSEVKQEGFELKLEGQAAAKATKKQSYVNRAMLAQGKAVDKPSREKQALAGFYHPSWHQERSLARCSRMNNKIQSIQKQQTNPDLKSRMSNAPTMNKMTSDPKLFRNKTMPGGVDFSMQPSKGRKLPEISLNNSLLNQNPKEEPKPKDNIKDHNDLESDYKGCHILLEAGIWDNIRRKNQMALTEFVRIVDPKPLHVSPREPNSCKSFRDSLKFLEKYYKTREKVDPNRIQIPDGGQEWHMSIKQSRSVSFEDVEKHGPQLFISAGGMTPLSTPRKDYNPALSPISETRRLDSDSPDKTAYGGPQSSDDVKGGPWWKQETLKIWSQFVVWGETSSRNQFLFTWHGER